jgi:hypothetical protein
MKGVFLNFVLCSEYNFIAGLELAALRHKGTYISIFSKACHSILSSLMCGLSFWQYAAQGVEIFPYFLANLAVVIFIVSDFVWGGGGLFAALL